MIHSVLAGFSDWNLVLNIINLLPIVALLIGGLIGFSRGARRLSWVGDSWMFAVFLYIVFLGIMEGILPELDPAVPVIIAAVVCSAVALFFFTIVRLVLKPREKKFDNLQMQKFLRREERFRIIEREEFEELEDPYDEEAREKLEKMQDKRRKKYLDKLDGRPGLLSRLFAAAFEGLDYAFVTNVVIDVLAIILMSTPLATGLLADFCNLDGFKVIYNEADRTALDHLFIGIIMCSVCIGYKKGVLSSVYGLLSGIATIGVVGFSFYIPFSPLTGDGQFLSFIGAMSKGIGDGLGGMLAGTIPFEIPSEVTLVIGQLASGLILFIVLQILMTILLKVLAGAVIVSEENPVFHIVDGILGVVLGAAICTLALSAVMFVLLVLEGKGWYYASTMLFEGTDLFSVCYQSVSNLLGSIVEQVISALPF
ncbi:MAG: CvpA family protein [Clostridiales bacterium]|nr:CvpA family protein [Clostridiales bacterium]